MSYKLKIYITNVVEEEAPNDTLINHIRTTEEMCGLKIKWRLAEQTNVILTFRADALLYSKLGVQKYVDEMLLHFAESYGMYYKSTINYYLTESKRAKQKRNKKHKGSIRFNKDNITVM
jgi:5'(3')-deoxyribonucleotidase